LTDYYTPIQVSGLSGVATAIQAGGFHTCAIISGGAVQCWGDNSEGQLGDGTKTPTPQTFPVTVKNINNAKALALGGNFTCVLLTTGTVQCWGNNNQGRLGNGTTTASLTPVSVYGISNAIAITVGRGHACAVLSGGTVKCWGDNSAGMLGNGTTTSSSFPVAVTGLTNAATLSAGAVHTCARLADNTVQCWGDNASAQIGPGSTTNSTTPATVLKLSPSTPITTATAVAAGSQHSCGLFNNNTVGCWGWNGSYQIGNSDFARSSSVSFVSGVTTATAITARGVAFMLCLVR
jgi:alpha-tubulin suppressor-like RCC1 family protein